MYLYVLCIMSLLSGCYLGYLPVRLLLRLHFELSMRRVAFEFGLAGLFPSYPSSLCNDGISCVHVFVAVVAEAEGTFKHAVRLYITTQYKYIVII